jgi:hypothetical protein
LFATGSVVSRNVSVIAAAVFAVLLLGVVQLGRAQSTSTVAGDVPAVTELYRMKLVRADTAARKVWSNYMLCIQWERWKRVDFLRWGIAPVHFRQG